jgi:heme/copper-type cytochrome/quinol oxidase subunit 4
MGIDGTIGDLRVVSRRRAMKGDSMHRFRSSVVSLALSILLTLLTAAAALADGLPPIPR